MKRGLNTVVVPTDGSNWSSGWSAFIDKSIPANNAYDAGTDELIAEGGRDLSHLSMTKNNAAAFFKYNDAGYTVTGSGLGNTTIEIARNDVAGPELLAYTRRIKVNATGRVRVCTPRSASDAQCDVAGLYTKARYGNPDISQGIRARAHDRPADDRPYRQLRPDRTRIGNSEPAADRPPAGVRVAVIGCPRGPQLRKGRGEPGAAQLQVAWPHKLVRPPDGPE